MRRLADRIRLVFERLRRRPAFWAVVLGALLVAAALLASVLGAARIAVAEIPRALADPAHPAHAVLWTVRLPRIAAGMLVGGALAVSGALLQAVVRNPVADPGILGVTAGAGLGGLLAICLWPAHPALVPALAFLGGIGAIAALLTAAWGGGRTTGPLRIVLSGVAIQAILFSLIALVTFFFADRVPAFVSFSIGSLNGLGWDAAALVLGPVMIGSVLALASTRALNLLLLDDDSAAGVGLSVRRSRVAASCLAALLTAAAASVAGLVGFVGLVVPNWVRVLVGPDHRVLLPLCLLGGGALLVLADTAARTVAAPLELPVGPARPRRRALLPLRSLAEAGMTPDAAVLRLRGVHVRHPAADRDALRDLALNVRAGEILALVGPNGSGKSTALAALGHTLMPRLGTVELDGAPAASFSSRAFARRVARLPQQPACPEGITVGELVRGGRHAHRRFLEALAERDLAAAREAMRAVDVLDLRHRRMETLSGGERRRAWLAMVLCQEAPVLLLDEPTAALDLRHQRELLALLRRLRDERGVTIVVVLHDLEQAAWLADRVAVLHRGRLYAAAPPADAIRPDTLRDVFGVEARVTVDDEGMTIRVLGPCDPLRFL